MKFRLIDKDGKQLHEAVMPLAKRPEVTVWGHRAFLFEYNTGENQDIPVYRETSVFKIGSFGR